MTEQVKEARMSAAVKLQRAFQREQEKSAASRKRGEELLKKPEQKLDQKLQQANEETLDQQDDHKKQLKKFKDMVDKRQIQEVMTGNPGKGYHGAQQTADDKYEELHAHVKNLTDSDDKTVKHYLDSGHGTKLAGREEDHAYIKKDFDKFMKYYRPKTYDKLEQQNEGTIQPSGTDKIEVAGNDVPAKQPKGKTVKSFKFFTTNESYTFDTAAMAKQELADAKNRKHRKRGKVANLLRKLGMKEEVEQIDELKTDTVKKYKEFSTLNAVGHAGNIYDREVEGGKKPDPEMHRKLAKRKEGIARADARLKKEETEMQQVQQEGVLDKVKAVGKKALETLGHGSDEQLRKDLQKKVGVPQTGQKPKKLREFIEDLKEGKVAKEVNVDKVNTAGEAPHEEKWEAAKKVKKESFTADQLLKALKEGLWPGTPEHTAKFGDKYKQQQGGGAGVKKGYRYGGSAQKPDAEDDNDADDKPAKKNK